MAKFSEGFGNKTMGYTRLNLDRVASLVSHPNRKGTLEAFDAEGDRLGLVDVHDIDNKPRGVVPELNGSVLIEFWRDEDGSVASTRIPIVAWSVEDGEAQPVTCDQPMSTLSEPIWCVEHRGGPWVFPWDRIFDTLNAAQEYAAGELRRKSEEDR